MATAKQRAPGAGLRDLRRSSDIDIPQASLLVIVKQTPLHGDRLASI